MNKGKINDSSKTDGNMDEIYERQVNGNNGNKYNIDLLNDIKNNLMNIDLMIIKDLNDLFMGIY